MARIELNVLGLSYSQTQSGAYALVLTEQNGERRIPIIIGGCEAQAIAIALENLQPPRPLTHDLFYNFAKTFEIRLKEVEIYKLEEGVFYSKLICQQGDREVIIDARTSDAIALAVRFVCPIYTTEEIMAQASMVMDSSGTDDDLDLGEEEAPATSQTTSQEFRRYSLRELKNLLEQAVNDEDYEKASLIRDEIKRREQQSQ
jgi:bifunctional DNase/RNase